MPITYSIGYSIGYFIGSVISGYWVLFVLLAVYIIVKRFFRAIFAKRQLRHNI